MAQNKEALHEPTRGLLMLLQEFFDSVYSLRPRMRSPRSVQFYRQEIAKLCRFAGRAVSIEDLSESLLLQSCQAQLKAGRSYATLQKHQTAIAALWKYAAKRAKFLAIEVPAVPDLDRWPKYDREPEAWSIVELSHLLSTASRLPGVLGKLGVPRALWWPALILTCYETGGRISAVMAARSADFSFENKTLLLRAEAAKDKADSLCFISSPLCDYLKQIATGKTLFEAWPYDRTRSDAWPALNRHFGAIAKSAGLELRKGDKFHRLRRTFATEIASHRGEAIAQSLLGHSALSVTRRYLDKTKLSLPKASEILTQPTIERLKVVG